MYTVSLEAARINAGFSQKEAAKRVGVNATTLANWEKGKTAPDIDKFRKLCEVYGCPADLIFLKKKYT